MRAAQNDRLTRIAPGTPCGALMRRYWQPVALVEEFDPATDPRMSQRPIKPVRALGEDFILFRDEHNRFGLLDRGCPHRGADLAFARYEGDGLRCPFHGWKFDATGQCLDTPGEPEGSRHCDRVRARRYPVHEAGGVLFAWFGSDDSMSGTSPPPFPTFDCFTAPATHVFAYKGLWHCNWLQGFEVGIDPAHTSFLHRFLEDEPLEAVADNRAGKQFRSASLGQVAGERWPMTRVMRELHRPDIAYEPTPWGLQITTLRHGNAGNGHNAFTHVRITHAIFPHTFVIPLSETLTITQMHLPVDDTHTYWYSFFTSFAGPIDKRAMFEQRARHIPPTSNPQAADGPLPRRTTPLAGAASEASLGVMDYTPLKGRHNDWGFDAQEQRTRTFLGMGEDDINVHDQWAVESMGAIADRTREHLGTTDKVIIANRRMLSAAIDAVERGEVAPGVADASLAAQMHGPDTVDGIAPADAWDTWWRGQVRAKREAAPWSAANDAPSPPDPVAA